MTPESGKTPSPSGRKSGENIFSSGGSENHTRGEDKIASHSGGRSEENIPSPSGGRSGWGWGNARLLQWLALSAFILVLDQFTKYLVTENLRLHEAIAITPFFNLVLVYNPGAAFSFLADQSGWQKGLFVAIALGASVWIVYLLWKHPAEKLFCLALSLVLAGALGNVIDRLQVGAVIDFLDFHAYGWHWPAFNVADAAISCGAALLIWDAFFPRKRSPASNP